MKRSALKLKQVANISAGYPFRGKINESPGSGVFAVQMKDVSPVTGVNWASCIEAILEGKRNPDFLNHRDILFASRGSHNYAAIVEGQPNKDGALAVASPHFYQIRCNHNGVLPEYLVWFLNQKPCQRYFEQNAEGTLTKSIRRNLLEEVPIAVPSLEKQRMIIALSETLAEERKLVERLIDNGETLMSSIANDLLIECKE
jgi:hypothetical protein